MVIEVNSQAHTIFNFKDFDDIIGHDVYNAISEFTENKIDEKQNAIDNLEWELNSYEGSLNSYTHCFSEIDSEIEGLINYVDNAKRLNRNELKEKLSWIIKRINEEI